MFTFYFDVEPNEAKHHDVLQTNLVRDEEYSSRFLHRKDTTEDVRLVAMQLTARTFAKLFDDFVILIEVEMQFEK